MFAVAVVSTMGLPCPSCNCGVHPVWMVAVVAAPLQAACPLFHCRPGGGPGVPDHPAPLEVHHLQRHVHQPGHARGPCCRRQAQAAGEPLCWTARC